MTACRARPAATFWPIPAGPWAAHVETALPYLLLGAGTLVSLPQSGQTWPQRWITLGLVTVAAVWTLLTDTLPRLRGQAASWVPFVSFTGTLAIATVLMSREILFVIFMITGFFEAIRLKPRWLMFACLAATSILINTIGAGGPVRAFTEHPALWLPIVAVQTLAIGCGSLMSEHLSEQNEARRKALDELEAAQEENAGLHRQLLAQAREAGMLDERQRLSQEIHDTLAQGFTGIITQLEAAQQASGDQAEWRRHLATASALARENLAEARRSVRALRPEALDSAELPDALRGVVTRWADRAAIPIEFTATGTVRQMHPEIEATLLRVTQEALSNVAKHAGASRVGLTLSYMEDRVTLDVRDDGSGFDPEALPGNGGFGVTGMRQRVLRLAGTLDIESEPGSGTAISASLPAIEAQHSLLATEAQHSLPALEEPR